MIRKIICLKCRETHPALDPRDVADGFKSRDVFLSAKRPKRHGMTMHVQGEEPKFVATDLQCDHCETELDGDLAVARTVWNSTREGEPRCWEADYGTIIPQESAVLAKKLAK